MQRSPVEFDMVAPYKLSLIKMWLLLIRFRGAIRGHPAPEVEPFSDSTTYHWSIDPVGRLLENALQSSARRI